MIVQRFIDVWLSIPNFIILMTAMIILPRNIFVMILVLGITAGIGGVRLIRALLLLLNRTLMFRQGTPLVIRAGMR